MRLNTSYVVVAADVDVVGDDVDVSDVVVVWLVDVHGVFVRLRRHLGFVGDSNLIFLYSFDG